MPEWLGSGLQNRVHGFDSRRRLHHPSVNPTIRGRICGSWYQIRMSLTCDAVARMEAAPQDFTVLTQAYRDIASGDRVLADSLRDAMFPSDIGGAIERLAHPRRAAPRVRAVIPPKSVEAHPA